MSERAKTNSPRLIRWWHLFSASRHLTQWWLAWAGLLAATLGVGLFPPAGRAAGQKNTKEEVVEDQCLLFGTVFTDQGLALPGAEIRVRRASEKKFRWEAHSDRRGEFAVRVPRGEDYEITVKARGYAPMVRTADAKGTGRVDLVFKLQPAERGRRK